MIKLIYANAETSMPSGEQIGAHSVRSVTGASNVRRLTSGETKPPGLDEPCNPSVTGSLGRSIPGPRSRQRDFPVSTHEFPVHVEQIPCLARQGTGVQCTEMAAQIDTRSRQRRQKKRNSLLISLLSGNPRIAARSWLAAPASEPQRLSLLHLRQRLHLGEDVRRDIAIHLD
jgi:hypothetical protein